MPHSHENESGVAQFLIDNVALLPRGLVLDVAMGNGRNAVYLAGMGFKVEGVDISSERVNSALESAREAGVSLSARVADLEDGYRIQKGAYDLIICFYYLHRPLLSEISNGLKPGGMVIYETYIVDQAQWGKPKNPDHLLKHNELLRSFPDLRCLRYREGIIGPHKAIASIIAQKASIIAQKD